MKGPPSEERLSSGGQSNEVNERDVDFSDYMWMGEEMEEFDSKVGYRMLVNIIFRKKIKYNLFPSSLSVYALICLRIFNLGILKINLKYC